MQLEPIDFWYKYSVQLYNSMIYNDIFIVVFCRVILVLKYHSMHILYHCLDCIAYTIFFTIFSVSHSIVLLTPSKNQSIGNPIHKQTIKCMIDV